MSGPPPPGELLRRLPLFAQLSQGALDRLVSMLETHAFKAGQRVVSQGDTADRLYVIARGRAEVIRRDADGHGRLVGALDPGDALGQTALNHPARRSADILAATDIVAYALPLARFADHCGRHPDDALAVLEALSTVLTARLRDVNDQIARAHADNSPTDFAFPQTRPSGQDRAASASWASFLPLLPLFQDVTSQTVRQMLPFLREWRLSSGACLFEEGAQGDSCFITTRGSVDITLTRGGKAQRLGTFGPGRLLGELSLLDGAPRSATCTVREAAVLLEIDAQRLADLRKAAPPAALALRRVFNRAIAESLGSAYGTLRRLSPDLAALFDVVQIEPDTADTPTVASEAAQAWREDALVQRVREGRLGADTVVAGPLGPRRVVFADHLGGERALDFIEDTLRRELLTRVGNPGPAPRGLGQHSVDLRKEARTIIRDAVGAAPTDIVRVTGHGAVGALDDLLEALNLQLPPQIDRIYGLRSRIPADERPVVFLSRDLAAPLRARWTRSLADVVEIPTGPDGLPSALALSEELRAHAHRPFRIGCFPLVSAHSGLVLDDATFSTLLHDSGALAVWDASGALADAPVVMRPLPDRHRGTMAYADALLIDPSPLPGGVGCPGVLVGRRELVADILDAYSHEPGAEGAWIGLPDHGAVLRTALVLQVRAAIGPGRAQQRVAARVQQAMARWKDAAGLRIYGDVDAPRLATVCLSMHALGHNAPASLVLTLLDDLFGVQARELEGQEHRFAVDFSWHSTDAEFDYICRSVAAVARSLGQIGGRYRLDGDRWVVAGARDSPRLKLADFRYRAGTMEILASRTHADESVLQAQLERGLALLDTVSSAAV